MVIPDLYRAGPCWYDWLMGKLDEANRKILELLQKDSSITNQELASRIGLSPASTLERVKKLEQGGIIKRYVALVDEKRLGKHVKVFVSITMKDHSDTSLQEFNRRIQEFPEVLECCRLAGEKDYLLKIIVDNIEDYEIFTRTRLSTLPGIDKTSSSIVLASIVDHTDIVL